MAGLVCRCRPGAVPLWSPRKRGDDDSGASRAPRSLQVKITDVKTFLVDASPAGGWSGGGRNWLFVKVETDAGIYGLGEASGWPRVVETAIQDLTPVVVGEDPGRIEYLWQKMLLAMMGHGMTGVVGGGAMTGIEIALWDILGKKLGVPVCDLLGGRLRDRVRVYVHASTPERAHELIERGYTCLQVRRLGAPGQDGQDAAGGGRGRH